MDKFKKYMVIDCYAFTIIVLINALFQTLDLAKPAPMTYCLYMFLVSSVVAILMFLTDRFVGSTERIKGIWHIVDVLVPVLFFSMLQAEFRLSMKQVVMTMIVCIVVYVIVCLMMYLSWREQDVKLNESIQKMRNKKQNR